jgi:putative ABC transport system permease protein
VTFARVALRNLARNRRRTAATLAVVAAGTVALLLTAGFVRFSFDGLADAMIHGGLGHLEVATRAAIAAKGPAALDRPLASALQDWRPLRAELEQLPHVVAVGANLQVLGLAQNAAGASFSFVGVGVEPERERAMGFETRLRAGARLEDAPPPPGEDGVLLASGLAASLGVAPGDVVTLLATNADGMLNALDVEVLGVFTTGVADLDTRFLKLHLASAARLLQSERASNLLVALDETAATAEAATAARTLLAGREPELAVVPWTERAAFYDQVRGLYRGIFWFLGSIVFVLVVLATSNTLAMTVLERIRELGALRALGTSRAQVAGMLLAESLWLGILGSAAGCVAGAAATVGMNAAHLRMPPPPGAVDPIDLQLAFVPEAYLLSVALMLVVLTVAALPPIVRAARLPIVEALGHV